MEENKTKITASTILDWVQERVANKEPLDSALWLEIAFKLTALLSDETNLLWERRQKVAQKKLGLLTGQDKKNVSYANAEVEATDEYREMRQQESMVKRVEEFVRIAKIQSRAEGGF